MTVRLSRLILLCIPAFAGLTLLPADAMAACTAQGTWSGAFSALPAGTPTPDFSGAADACVRIEADVCVDFDEPAAVHVDSIRIEGALRFRDTADRTLNAHKIVVAAGAGLRVGTQTNRFTHDANIELTDGLDCAASGVGEYVIGDDGAGGLIVSYEPSPTLLDFHPNDMMDGSAEPNRSLLVSPGATLQLHGAERSTTWTTLDAPVANGDTSMTVVEADDWDSDDEIIIASTDFDPAQAQSTWIDSVTAGVGADSITVISGMTEHWSGQLGGSLAGVPDVFASAEVALLSHNVKVFSPDWSDTPNLYPVCGNDAFWAKGAEIKIARHGGDAPLVEIENIEVFNAGKFGSLGHYPIHFHHGGDMLGSYVRGVSVHGSSNRAIVLHGTQRVEIADNVVNDIVGHAYYLERSGQHDTKHNWLSDNLGMGIFDCNPLDVLSVGSSGAAVFYFEDPRNSFVGNVAAGSQFAGFYYAQSSSTDSLVPDASTDNWYMCGDDEIDYTLTVPAAPLDTGGFSYANVWYDDDQYEAWGYAALGAPPECEGAFAHNTAHSTQNGLYANEHRNTFLRIVDFTAYKNAQRATMIKNRGATEMVRLMAADNGSAVWPASHAYHAWYAPSYLVIDSNIVGASANVGDPVFYTADEATIGRSIPNDQTGYDIYGIEVYEGRLHVADTYLQEFPPAPPVAPRHVAAFGRHRAFPFYSNNVDNSVRSVAIAAGSQPLFFEDPGFRENGNPVTDAAGYVSVMLQDLDGSLGTGVRSTFVAADDFIIPGQIAAPAPYLTFLPNANAYFIEDDDVTYGQVLVRWCDVDGPIECNAYHPGTGALGASQNWTQEGQGTGVIGMVQGMQIEDVTDGDILTADHSPDGLHTRLGANVIAGHEFAVDFFSDAALATLHDPGMGDLDPIEAMEVQYRFAPASEAITVSIAVPAVPDEVFVIYGDDASVTPAASSPSALPPMLTEEWYYDAAESRVELYIQPVVNRETVAIYFGFGDQ